MIGLFVLIAIVAVVSVVVVGFCTWYYSSWVAGGIAAIMCVLVFGGLICWNWATTYRNDHWATCTITGKDRGGDNGSYRIYTSNCGQLSNQDSFLRGKFNSADLWQKIPDNGVVELRIAGMRWGLISHFPNVFDVREVKSQG